MKNRVTKISTQDCQFIQCSFKILFLVFVVATALLVLKKEEKKWKIWWYICFCFTADTINSLANCLFLSTCDLDESFYPCLDLLHFEPSWISYRIKCSGVKPSYNSPPGPKKKKRLNGMRIFFFFWCCVVCWGRIRLLVE